MMISGAYGSAPAQVACCSLRRSLQAAEQYKASRRAAVKGVDRAEGQGEEREKAGDAAQMCSAIAIEVPGQMANYLQNFEPCVVNSARTSLHVHVGRLEPFGRPGRKGRICRGCKRAWAYYRQRTQIQAPCRCLRPGPVSVRATESAIRLPAVLGVDQGVDALAGLPGADRRGRAVVARVLA